MELSTWSILYVCDDSAEGSFQIQFEQSRSTKNQEEESCKHPSLSLMKKPPPRDRELDQAMPTSGSAPKKLKKS